MNLFLLKMLGLIDTSTFPQIGDNSNAPIKALLQIALEAMGAIAVLIIAIAGFKLTISRGDPQAVARSKDTIIYAAVGLVVVVAAFSIVTFVVGNI